MSHITKLLLGASLLVSPLSVQSAEPHTVPTISALLDIDTPEAGQLVYVEGFHEPGDGAGGDFAYRLEREEPHDGGMIIDPGAPDPGEDIHAYLEWDGDPAAGHWFRMADDDSTINARWYGARGDGNQNDQVPLDRAKSYLSSREMRGVLHIPEGHYNVSLLRLSPGIDVRGDGISKTVLQGPGTPTPLVRGGGEELDAEITNLTFTKPEGDDWRLVRLRGVSHVAFRHVQFRGGVVEFRDSSDIVIDHCVFTGKAGERGAYASSGVDNATITNNIVKNPMGGGFNLSGHTNSVAAGNLFISDTRIDTGYGGIRLPNGAMNNVVANNTIIGAGRGIFVLSGSEHNIVRDNRIAKTYQQGMLIETPNNTIKRNIISDTWGTAIRVTDTGWNVPHNERITAENILLRDNVIVDTDVLDWDDVHSGRGLHIQGVENRVLSNTVISEYQRPLLYETRSENMYENNTFSDHKVFEVTVKVAPDCIAEAVTFEGSQCDLTGLRHGGTTTPLDFRSQLPGLEFGEVSTMHNSYTTLVKQGGAMELRLEAEDGVPEGYEFERWEALHEDELIADFTSLSINLEDVQGNYTLIAHYRPSESGTASPAD